MLETPEIEGLYIFILPDTPLGRITLGASQTGMACVELASKTRDTFHSSKDNIPRPAAEILSAGQFQITEYLAGRLRSFDLPLDWRFCTPFQMGVLKETLKILYGQVISYQQLAKRLGRAGGNRAVGHALAHNPIPLIVPCHRVIGADGSLCGYSARGGLQTKAWLLRLEGAILLAD